MFFLGQEGVHEFGSDYVAVSYVKGHVLGWGSLRRIPIMFLAE